MPIKKQSEIDPIKLHDLILKSLSEEYPNDHISPGLVSSYILRSFNPKNSELPGKYYVSICRYGTSYQDGKKILFKAHGETYLEALLNTTTQWLNLHNNQSTKDELIKYIKDNT